LKKILPIILVGILIISGIGAVVNGYSPDKMGSDKQTDIISMTFSPITIKDNSNGYIDVVLKDETSYFMNTGKPILPNVVEVVEIPFGAQNVQITVLPTDIKEYKIQKEIRPAPTLLPLTSSGSISVKNLKDDATYASKELFPSNWHSYKIGCGLNSAAEHVTLISINVFPVRYAPAIGKICAAEHFEISITYENPKTNPFPENSEYDMVIIAPSKFSSELMRLVNHKNGLGVINTTLKTTEEIYDEYPGLDKPEQIKYFIRDALETWNIKYVLLVGGLKSVVYAKPRDDANQGSKGWYVPVRYTNLYDDPAFPLNSDSTLHDPGVISDLYYADIYMDGGDFSDWDTNDDGIFAAWRKPGVENDTNIDFLPDVCLGRLACRTVKEVSTVVNKIITYESSPIDQSWFRKMIVVSGDGFLDQKDLNIQWNTNQIPNGNYTIKAQSSNPEGEYGPIISVNVTKDSEKESIITYSHDDHLNPAIQDAFINGFPTVPIAEIITVSEGNILGNTDVEFEPTSNAYCNEFFYYANVSYVGGILTIRGKSYDPKPYGNLSSIHVWIENDESQIIFSDWRNNTETYYEGEWVTGEKAPMGRGGALYYMPDDFEREILWASNGKFTGMDDVINAVNEGSGFLFFSGHGSPNSWGDQYPGIPGDRGPASVTGLLVTTLRIFRPMDFLKISEQNFPIDTLSNGDKLPITVIGGCHNSQFNVSMIPGLLEGLEFLFPAFPKLYMWCHGAPVPECFSWRIIRNPNGGAIATMGNSGLGYGVPGVDCTTGGGDAWITIEFFRQYGEKGHDILGEAYQQTLTSYINSFDMNNLEEGHPKTVTQWILLGDPSLKIGGYS